MAELELNFEQFNEAVEDAFTETCLALVGKFVFEMTSYKWDWPRETVRRPGFPAVGSPRDIVDTNELRGSMSAPNFARELSTGNPMCIYTWTADHALVVHEGAVTRSGTELPARPWTKEPLEEFNGIFHRHARRKLSAIQ